jgi:hypothetical protein
MSMLMDAYLDAQEQEWPEQDPKDQAAVPSAAELAWDAARDKRDMLADLAQNAIRMEQLAILWKAEEAEWKF